MIVKGTHLQFNEDGVGTWEPYQYEGTLEGFLREVAGSRDRFTNWVAHKVTATNTDEGVNQRFFNSFVDTFRYITAVTGRSPKDGYLRLLDISVNAYHSGLTLLESYEGDLQHLKFDRQTNRFPFLEQGKDNAKESDV